MSEHHNCAKPCDVKLRPFVQHLLNMDARIRVFPFYGDVEYEKGFFCTKEHIFFPYELPQIEHDISHLVELTNPKRWTMTDWGLPRFDKDKVRPQAFFAAFARETRTRAIQQYIQPECIGDDTSSAYNQLANSYWHGMMEKLLPYGRFKTMQDVKVWMNDLRERTFKRWSMDRIEHEWKFRLCHIQNWMETHEG